ncbi:MAG: hypothetical protein ACLQVG_17835 [Terriglobia bacterium]|jgi:hypothetical protein
MPRPSSNKSFQGDITAHEITSERVSRMFTRSDPQVAVRAPKKSDDTPRRESAPRPSISTLHFFGNGAGQNRTLERVKEQFRALFNTQ